MDDEKQLVKLNRKVKQLFDLYPIAFDEPAEPTYEMRFALARFYTDDGVRKFLESAINKARAEVMDATTVAQILIKKERINTLLQLLTTSKALFSQAEKLNKGLEQYASEVRPEKV